MFMNSRFLVTSFLINALFGQVPGLVFVFLGQVCIYVNSSNPAVLVGIVIRRPSLVPGIAYPSIAGLIALWPFGVYLSA